MVPWNASHELVSKTGEREWNVFLVSSNAITYLDAHAKHSSLFVVRKFIFSFLSFHWPTLSTMSHHTTTHSRVDRSVAYAQFMISIELFIECVPVCGKYLCHTWPLYFTVFLFYSFIHLFIYCPTLYGSAARSVAMKIHTINIYIDAAHNGYTACATRYTQTLASGPASGDARFLYT